MLRKRGRVYLVTFHTTADAMALERLCRESGCPGRLLPVTRAVTSDCGIAWASPIPEKARLDELIQSHRMDCAGTYEMEL